MTDTAIAERQELLVKLAVLEKDAERRRFLSAYPELADALWVETLCTEIGRVLWADLDKAKRLAGTARWLAETLDDDRCRALAARVAANVHHSAGENAEAQELYDDAHEGFEKIGDELEAAITRSSALINLAHLGEHDRVREWEEAAREVFESRSDRQRLAVLENNYAIVLCRQDRWQDALERYSVAYEEFLKLGRSQNAAVCLHNIAVCHISLHHFEEALAVHEKTRAYCQEQGLDRLKLQADYNIAYLYYLRGEYTRALKRYRETRRRCETAGDEYHQALCDLDRAEIYLELNMVEEAAQQASSAVAGFETLGLPYELAKARTNRAIALSRQGKGERALEELERAREIFLQEQNHLWPALIDFYRAVVLHREHRPDEALDCARIARETFSQSALASKAVMCDLLLAEILLDLDRAPEARETCGEILERLQDLDLPVLKHQAWLVQGRVEEALGRDEAALAAYRQSRRWLEQLCGQLHGEDFKIAFLSDKHVLYESLVWLTLGDKGDRHREETAFRYIEQSRSRSLADLMSFRAHDLPAPSAVPGELADQVRRLREELNWFYRQIDLREMRGGERSLQEVAQLRRRARTKEDDLLRSLRDLRSADQEYSSLQSGVVVDLDSIRASLPEGAELVEYFLARGTVFGCVVARDRLVIQPVTSADRAQAIHRCLQFQLSRMSLGPEHVDGIRDLVEEATRAHLGALHDELVAPLLPHLEGRQLIIVPHGFLHYVPFHALHDGERYLIDRFSISYAPSASVFHLCAAKRTVSEDRSLVLGVADKRAPRIMEEVQAVAESLPRATLLTDDDATEAALRRYGANSRFIHVATHGLFRRDNPMFSAIQLGRSRLSLFDLYNLRLGAELVVLSGCGTGLNAVLGADELVGLTRGVLYAGAQSVVVSLWDVNDASTAELMRRFYLHLQSTHRAEALRRTMLEIREIYPHPYHWAPFVLVGKPD